ncbi:MAG: type IV secretion system DNA-binding domain-containing protein [Sedimentisphaerales bacterium]|nr:type IV secretion system DNA-binding domain-containing protein [Sedimentisphaerales bacterium]
MTVGAALVTYAGPYMLAAKANALVEAEVRKGCLATVLGNPVALEPAYSQIAAPKDLTALADKPCWIDENPPADEEIVRFRVWISPDQPFDWNCFELFLRQLCLVSHRVGLEITGNQERITVSLMCHREDIPIVTTAFCGKLKFCKLSTLDKDPFFDVRPEAWEDIQFYDYLPGPPYSHLLTRPNELYVCPYECLITAISNIPDPGVGIYQVLFQPVDPAHNWHRNIEILMDLEYIVKLVANVGHFQRYAMQAPSGDLRQMAGHVETKAHNDKPFYAAALRVAVLGTESFTHEYLQSMSTFSTLFQHGGIHLQVITEADYQAVLSPSQIHRMFQLGLTYRPGFLVNSAELTGLAHVPPASIVEQLDISGDTLDTLSLTSNHLSEGTRLGTCTIASEEKPVCIPRSIRMRHTHLIGRPGTGKSTLEEHMIVDDIKNDQGVAVLDPHGDLSERLLGLIPEEYVDKVIYFDPSDPYWVPLWNPMQKVPGQDIGRMTDDLVGVLKSFVSGWGDRLEHILRHCIFALLHLSGSTLLDIAHLLRSGSRESEVIRKLILDILQNEEARKFWEHDFMRYRADEFTPPKHKLSKLLVGGTVSLMLSQPNSRFNFRRIMDDGMIFLANLSKLGTEVREVLGGFILAIMHSTAISRSDTPVEKRRPFQIYLDEAHRFVTDSLEDIIAETRKYAVGMTFAHQYIHQFGAQKTNALGSVGTTIVFNVDSKDAAYLAKDFQDQVKPDDIVNLELWQAVIRCGTDIAKFTTLPPLEIPEKNFKEQIIANSRKNYYMPVPQVHSMMDRRNKQADTMSQSIAAPVEDNEKLQGKGDWSYDEL